MWEPPLPLPQSGPYIGFLSVAWASASALVCRERGEPIPPEQSLEAARQIKERHAYVCADMVKEFAKYDENPGKYLRQYQGTHYRYGRVLAVKTPHNTVVGWAWEVLKMGRTWTRSLLCERTGCA